MEEKLDNLMPNHLHLSLLKRLKLSIASP